MSDDYVEAPHCPMVHHLTLHHCVECMVRLNQAREALAAGKCCTISMRCRDRQRSGATLPPGIETPDERLCRYVCRVDNM